MLGVQKDPLFAPIKVAYVGNLPKDSTKLEENRPLRPKTQHKQLLLETWFSMGTGSACKQGLL